jgi:hypothetical protein
VRIPNAVPQTRMVSGCDIQLNRRKSARLFKRVLWDNISEFESDLPSQAVGSLPRDVSPKVTSLQKHVEWPGSPSGDTGCLGVDWVRRFLSFHMQAIKEAASCVPAANDWQWLVGFPEAALRALA